jgi:hypothetical protein
MEQSDMPSARECRRSVGRKGNVAANGLIRRKEDRMLDDGITRCSPRVN